ncbi:MAG: nuclear transport factor 2 family protein [Pseudonocardiaceae bacterium]|nr:nuclear transport factor 2 family protein [Pseudonocardiaceae bacterium]
MSTGALVIVEEWLGAVNRRDSDRVEDLSDEEVEVAGPRGTVRGRQILSGWLARAGFSAEPLRWFCGGDGTVVVEQDACWVDVATGKEKGRAVVASQFLVDGARVTRYVRHDDLGAALAATGLDDPGDEVTGRNAH